MTPTQIAALAALVLILAAALVAGVRRRRHPAPPETPEEAIDRLWQERSAP